jgi:excisionase family DNA binding protein
VTPPIAPQLLTVRQIAEQLAVKEGTVRLWIGQRRLSAVRVGRCVRVSQQTVIDLIQRSTVPGREERR